MSGEEPIRPSSQNFLLNKNALIQLQNNDPALTSLTIGVDLHMYNMSRTDGFVPHENDWGKLGRFIGRNTHITELRFGNLGGSNFNSETRELDMGFMFGGGSSSDKVYPPRLEQFKEFCSGLANNTSVKKVDFIDAPEIQGYRLQRAGWGIAYLVMSGWFQNDVIEEISMPVCTCEDGNYDNSIESSKMATVLAKFSSLKKFYIEFDGDIDGDESEPCEVSAEIINALVNHTDLEDLSLSHGRKSWSREGYVALARFLSNSKVKELQLSGGSMSDEGVQAIAGALGENDTLKEIIIDDDCVTSTGWKAFAALLSNPVSIMDTYNSNHTIQKLLRTSWYSRREDDFEEREIRRQKSILGDELYSLLRVNTLCNKSDAARVKIILRHLSEDFSMEPFAGMNVATMPYALAWMGKSNPDIASLYPFADADLCLMYKFVRGVAPVLFEASPSAGSKRKISSEPE